MFAAVGGEILAYPITCEAACAPVWRAEVPGETWWLFVDGYRLVAVSRMGGVMALGITITVFEASSEEPPVFFPVWSSLSQPGAIVSGSLVEHDGCLFLRSGDEQVLALWEEGYRYVDGTLLDASGRVVVRVGDELAPLVAAFLFAVPLGVLAVSSLAGRGDSQKLIPDVGTSIPIGGQVTTLQQAAGSVPFRIYRPQDPVAARGGPDMENVWNIDRSR